MKKIIVISIFCILILSSCSVASVFGIQINKKISTNKEDTKISTLGGETWMKTFGGIAADDYGASVQQTSGGGYIVTGTTQYYAPQNCVTAIWLMKISDSGEMDWQQTYGWEYTQSGNSVQETDDGGYIITGDIKDVDPETPEHGYDLILIKTDEEGEIEWYRAYGEEDNDEYGAEVQQTNDGGYIIIGTSHVEDDIWVIKTDEMGDVEWDKTYGTPTPDYGSSIKQTTDGGYILCGSLDRWGENNHEIGLIKIDNYGIEEWRQTYGSINDDFGESVQQTNDGGYIITGSTNHHLCLIKTDSLGIVEWETNYFDDSEENSEGYEVQQTTDGGYIVTGYVFMSMTNGPDLWLIKTDEMGNKEWMKTFGGITDEGGTSVQQTTDGGYIISGSKGTGPWYESYEFFYDLWLIKTNSDGEVKNKAILSANMLFSKLINLIQDKMINIRQ